MINVPTAKRPVSTGLVPPAGVYKGTVKRLTLPAEADDVQEATITWAFRADNRNWTLQQAVDMDGLADVLVDVGFGGQSIDPVAAVGRKAMLTIRTFGGRTSAKVTQTDPVPAS